MNPDVVDVFAMQGLGERSGSAAGGGLAAGGLNAGGMPSGSALSGASDFDSQFSMKGKRHRGKKEKTLDVDGGGSEINAKSSNISTNENASNAQGSNGHLNKKDDNVPGSSSNTSTNKNTSNAVGGGSNHGGGGSSHRGPSGSHHHASKTDSKKDFNESHGHEDGEDKDHEKGSNDSLKKHKHSAAHHSGGGNEQEGGSSDKMAELEKMAEKLMDDATKTEDLDEVS